MDRSGTRSDGPGGEGESARDGLRRILLNAASLLGAYVLPRAFTFAAAVVAARALGVADFGAYGTAAALAVILSIVSTLGMMQLLVRELARAPERAPTLIGAANLAKVGSGVVMMATLAFVAAGPLGLPGDVVAASLLLGLSYAVGAFGENVGAWFEAVERMGVWMQAQALFGFVSGVGGIVLALTTRSLVWFCLAPVLGQVAALAWLLARAQAEVARAWRAPWPEVRALLVSLVPFTAAFIALTAYYKIDIVLVERWRGDAEAGMYAAAYKFVDVAQALALVAATALYPRLSRAAAGDAAGGRAKGSPATRATELLLLAGVPAAAILWLVREPLVHGLFGDAYGDSVRVLALLAPALPALALNMLATYVLAAAGRMGAVATVYGGGLVLTVVLDRLLIPSMGASGAATAMLVSETVVAVVFLAVTGRLVAARPSLRALGAAGVVGGVAALLGTSALGPPAAVAALAVASAAIYAGLRVVAADEVALLRRAILE